MSISGGGGKLHRCQNLCIQFIRITFCLISHGFINGDVHSKIDLEVLRRREQKWLHMSKNWDDFMVHNYKKVRSRCRKGIPPATRPTAWSHLCGAKYMLEGTDGDQSNENIPTFEMLRVSFIRAKMGLS